MTNPFEHDDFGGLRRDLPRLLDRRGAIRWMGGASLAGLLVACGSGDDATTADTTTTTTTATTATTATTGTVPEDGAAGTEIPDETAGPFPADGSNGPDVLGEPGVVRADIRSSIGAASGTAEGVPTTVELTIVDAASGEPVPGAAVYLWHCTADGRYSIYEVEDQNYLRGVQVADDDGRVAFITVFPGCYAGRWPHCHFEVFETVDLAVAGGSAVKTSQLALPQADCETVYGDPRYGSSTDNLGQLSLTTDGVFRDGWDDQLATVVGAGTDNVTASLLVRI